MTSLLLIRHGQSIANLEGVFAGHFDSPLSPIGIEQAKLTAKFVTENYNVDKVYSSDLKRAFSVGREIAAILGIEVIKNENLREISAGLWEGVPFSVLKEKYISYREVWQNDIGNAVCDEGESVLQLQKRVVSEVKKIAVENSNKTVVITTHATPIRALSCYCKTENIQEMKNIPWVPNTSISEFEYENGNLKLIRMGYDEHLGNIRTHF